MIANGLCWLLGPLRDPSGASNWPARHRQHPLLRLRGLAALFRRTSRLTTSAEPSGRPAGIPLGSRPRVSEGSCRPASRLSSLLPPSIGAEGLVGGPPPQSLRPRVDAVHTAFPCSFADIAAVTGQDQLPLLALDLTEAAREILVEQERALPPPLAQLALPS